MSVKHHCPGCGIELARNLRYPWYFCRSCVDAAEDAEGRALGFENAEMSGGLTWFYRDDPQMADNRASVVHCCIGEQPVMISEARFGGIVGLPTVWPLEFDHEQLGPHAVILSLATPALLQQMRARLKPGARRR